MNIKISYWLLILTVISLMACDDEAKPKTVPFVLTSETVSGLTKDAVTISGEIANDGNADITETGFVYSSVIELPTLSNEKIVAAMSEDDFLTTTITGLSSGTTYYVRAYATNEVGTGYGEAISFTTSNAVPTALDVIITGELVVAQDLTGSYTYSDNEGDVEAASTFQWYRADDAIGTGEVAIAGATEDIYTIQDEDVSKYLRFGVTPMAATGATEGEEVRSSFTAGIGEETEVTFIYRDEEVTYGIIISSVTGRKWLDRNLGASSVPSSYDDWANYGDLFQWGRSADGHQYVTRSGVNNDGFSSDNGTIGPDPVAQESTDTPPHSQFIIVNPGTDWRNPSNDNLWQGVKGINNPCPKGWRLATAEEWASENLTDMSTAYTRLNISYTGTRTGSTGDYAQATLGASYWTSTPQADGKAAKAVILASRVIVPFSSARSSGNVCRCIKD